MQMLLLSICLVLAASAKDDPPPILVPDQIWAAEAGVHPTTQPARIYDGIADALKTVPQGVLPSKPGEWNDAKIDAANVALEAHVQKRMMRIRINVAGVTRYGENNGYYVTAKPVATPVITTEVQADFSAREMLEVARLTTGDDVLVEGTVTNMHFEPPKQYEGDKPSFMVLSVELGDCQVLK